METTIGGKMLYECLKKHDGLSRKVASKLVEENDKAAFDALLPWGIFKPEWLFETCSNTGNVEMLGYFLDKFALTKGDFTRVTSTALAEGRYEFLVAMALNEKVPSEYWNDYPYQKHRDADSLLRIVKRHPNKQPIDVLCLRTEKEILQALQCKDILLDIDEGPCFAYGRALNFISLSVLKAMNTRLVGAGKDLVSMKTESRAIWESTEKVWYQDTYKGFSDTYGGWGSHSW
jgi:hypothetical protein